jgi:hypothetical protein
MPRFECPYPVPTGKRSHVSEMLRTVGVEVAGIEVVVVAHRGLVGAMSSGIRSRYLAMTVAATSAAEAGGADPRGTTDWANPNRRPAATAPLTALPRVMSLANGARPCHAFHVKHHLAET